MTARNAAAIASFVLLCGVAACTNFYEIPIETPIQPKMDVSPFQRVLVAGFIGGGTEDVDANLETVRLLRSQLRSKSNLRVIEAEVLPLANIAAEQGRDKAASSPPGGAADGQQQQPNEQEARIHNEKDLEKYQGIFADVAFWKKLGEEYQNPLIVTGTRALMCARRQWPAPPRVLGAAPRHARSTPGAPWPPPVPLRSSPGRATRRHSRLEQRPPAGSATPRRRRRGKRAAPAPRTPA